MYIVAKFEKSCDASVEALSEHIFSGLYSCKVFLYLNYLCATLNTYK